MKNIKSDKANLEKKRGLFFQIGFIIAFSLLLLAFEWGSELSNKKDSQLVGIDIETEMTPITRQKELKPPQPKEYTKYEIVKDETENIRDIKITSVEIEPNDRVEIPVIELDTEIEEPKKSKIWAITEEEPKFPGGMKGLQHVLAKNTKYPTKAIENDMQGKVYVRFVINEKGEVENAHVLRSVYPILDKEALRVVRSLPNWKPGKQSGKAVKVWFTVPIVFKLQ